MNKELKERKAVFYYIFDYCGSFLLELGDDDLEGTICEDYRFHYADLVDEKLEYLKKNNVLTDILVEKAKKLKILSDKEFLGDSSELSAKFIRYSDIWREIFQLADFIKIEVNKMPEFAIFKEF